jgi:transcriptional regulator with XRE-family HTH domain
LSQGSKDIAESSRERMTEKDPLYPNNIGYCIKKYGYTYSELAAEIGIDRKTLYLYCSGQHATPKYTLEKIAKTLGCSIEELRFLPQTMKPQSNEIGSNSLTASTHDAIEIAEGQVVSLQEWQAAIGQKQEAFDMDNGRRDLLQQIFYLTGSALANELFDSDILERLAKALKRSSPADRATLDQLETVTRKKRQSFVL